MDHILLPKNTESLSVLCAPHWECYRDVRSYATETGRSLQNAPGQWATFRLWRWFMVALLEVTSLAVFAIEVSSSCGAAVSTCRCVY